MVYKKELNSKGVPIGRGVGVKSNHYDQYKFYIKSSTPGGEHTILNERNRKHAVQLNKIIYAFFISCLSASSIVTIKVYKICKIYIHYKKLID